jgi:hypothetical protein
MVGSMPIPTRLVVALAALCLVATATGCADSDGEGGNANGGRIDPTPQKLDGSSSQEFEAEDIEQAESASEEVKAYCSGAVSEAQEAGCLSHVDEDDIP